MTRARSSSSEGEEPMAAAAAATTTVTVTVGTEVLYVPGLDHALDRHREGGRLYVITDADGEELTDRDFRNLKRDGGNLTLNRKPIVYVKPREFWRALVTAVRPDGTADLDVFDGGTGVLLHYPARKHDPTDKKPDTFHLQGE